jgi:hypothetical protein
MTALFIIKLKGENYFLAQGPTGYAFARSRKRAKKFATREEAEHFVTCLSGNVEVIEE